MSAHPPDLIQTLVKHDTAIEHLGSQMKTLQGEVHHGFSSINATLVGLNSKFDKFDATPKFDFHKTVKTVQSLAILFSLVTAGIIWISSSHFATTIAEQKAKIISLEEKVGWSARVQREAKP